MVPRHPLHKATEFLVEKTIPNLSSVGRPFPKVEGVAIPRGDQDSGPEAWSSPLDPAIGKGRDHGRMTQPGTFTGGAGRTLVGEEGDQAGVLQMPMHGADGFQVVHHVQSETTTQEAQEPSPRRMGGSLGDTEGVTTQASQDRRQPFPLAVMHGEKQRGPCGRPLGELGALQDRQIQSFPPPGEDAKDLQESRGQEPAIEVGGSLNSQSQELIPREGGSRKEGEDRSNESREADFERSIPPGSSIGDLDGQILNRLVA